MRFPEDVFEQNNKQAQPNFNFGPDYQRGNPPGLANSPPKEGGGKRAGPHHSQPRSAPPSFGNAFNARGGGCMWYLPKI
jgi:hypothetical protein